MTLNGVMALFCVISPNSVVSRAHCVKEVEDVVIKKFTFAISSSDEFILCLFPNADPVSVVRSSSGSWRSQATKYIS